MPNHAIDLGIAQLLRHGSPLLGIGAVIFNHRFKPHLLAANHHSLLVEFVNGHLHAIGVVFAVMRLAARHGGDRSQFHNLCITRSSRRGWRAGRRRRRCRFVAASQNAREGQNGRRRCSHTHIELHD